MSVRPNPVIPVCTGLLYPQLECFLYCWRYHQPREITHPSGEGRQAYLPAVELTLSCRHPLCTIQLHVVVMFNIFLIFYIQVAEYKKDHLFNENILQYI